MDVQPCGSQGLKLSAQGFGCMSLTKGESVSATACAATLLLLGGRARQSTCLAMCPAGEGSAGYIGATARLCSSLLVALSWLMSDFGMASSYRNPS